MAVYQQQRKTLDGSGWMELSSTKMAPQDFRAFLKWIARRSESRNDGINELLDDRYVRLGDGAAYQYQFDGVNRLSHFKI